VGEVQLNSDAEPVAASKATQQQQLSGDMPATLDAKQPVQDSSSNFGKRTSNASVGALDASSSCSSSEMQQQQQCVQLGSTELAFKCYVRAVHALQSLDLQGGVLPHLLADCAQDILATSGDSSAAAAAAEGGDAAPPAAAGNNTEVAAQQQQQPPPAQQQIKQQPGLQQQQQLVVFEDEQAELYCCWAESVLLKFHACSCPGCTSLAVQAIRMAHIAAARLFGRVQKPQQQHVQRWRAVGQALSRVVYAHIALLCQTEARASPSKASLWRAQQCLQEWDRLAAARLVGCAADSGEAAQDTQLVRGMGWIW
jgi:hypothetical protein